METARLSYTPVTAYMDMRVMDFMAFRMALAKVLEREHEAREAART